MIEHLKSHQDGILFLVCAGIALVASLLLLPGIWTATLPGGSPETVIAERHMVGRGRSSRLQSYIDVGDGLYECTGADRAREGTVVVYDASFPSRCRRPEDLWRLRGTERLFFAMLVMAVMGMIYAVVAFFFLSGNGPDQRVA